ncbi:hypothetical protein LEMLEM_LOCUS5749, partial [Lemmus lemmus]
MSACPPSFEASWRQAGHPKSQTMAPSKAQDDGLRQGLEPANL